MTAPVAIRALSPRQRTVLRDWFVNRENKLKCFYDIVHASIQPAHQAIFAALLDEPGFATFIQRRSKSGLRRFVPVITVLMKMVAAGCSVADVLKVAELITSLYYIRVERSYYFRPIDLEGAADFDECFCHIAAIDPGLARNFLDVMASSSAIFFTRRYRSWPLVRTAIMRQLTARLSAKRDTDDLLRLIDIFLEEDIDRLFLIASSALVGVEFAERIFAVFATREEIEPFIRALSVMVHRFGKTPEHALERINGIWSHLVDMSPDGLAPFGKFVALYSSKRKELEFLIWSSAFALPPVKARRAIELFVSDGFSEMAARTSNMGVLGLFVRTIILLIDETPFRSIDAGMHGIVLRLMLERSIDLNFLRRRGAFFKWASARNSSRCYELELIRILLFEYLFMASGAVPISMPQKMTKYCDEVHKQYVMVIDGVLGKCNQGTTNTSELAWYFHLDLLFKARIWAPVAPKFTKWEKDFLTLTSLAEDQGIVDLVMLALMELPAEEFPDYHAVVMDIFRNQPERLTEAVTPDFWYRVSFHQAAGYVSEVVIPLVGMVPVVKSVDTAATDGSRIILPGHVSYFHDKRDPLEDNRNLAAYVALGLHEAGHILAGSFSIDYRDIIARVEYPELLHLLYNVVEDSRIERVVIQLDSHPQAANLFAALNSFLLLRNIGSAGSPAIQLIWLLMASVNGYDLPFRTKGWYLEAWNTQYALAFDCGRFRNMKALCEYFIQRIGNMDICNPLASMVIAREIYDIIAQWPDELLRSMRENKEVQKAARQLAGALVGMGAGSSDAGIAPKTKNELEDLYRECNEHPERFLTEKLHNQVLARLAKQRKSRDRSSDPKQPTTGAGRIGSRSDGGKALSEDDAGRGEGVAGGADQEAQDDVTNASGHGTILGQLAGERMLDLIDQNNNIFDYSQDGTIADGVRTRVDNLAGEAQRLGMDKPVMDDRMTRLQRLDRKKAVKKVYSVDARTKSRTKLSAIQVFDVSNIDSGFMSLVHRWDALALRVYEQFARLLSDLFDSVALNTVDGDLCIEELIGVLASGQTVGVREYLEVESEQRLDIEVVIGLDISGSTNSRIGGVSVLDIEKAFALIFGRAMQMLTKNVNCYAFNSMTSTNVYRMKTIEAVSSLTSDQANRDGDFIRYMTGLLAEASAAKKYFIMISDGRPCAPTYDGREALEDTLIAMRECREAGVKLIYCNIDRFPQDYFHLMAKEASWAASFSHPEEILSEIANLAATITRGCA